MAADVLYCEPGDSWRQLSRAVGPALRARFPVLAITAISRPPTPRPDCLVPRLNHYRAHCMARTASHPGYMEKCMRAGRAMSMRSRQLRKVTMLTERYRYMPRPAERNIDGTVCQLAP